MRWARELRRVDLITAREDLTVEYLAGLGVAENVIRVADPAFVLPRRTYGHFPEAFRNSVLIGIGMSDLVAKGGCGPSMYLDAFADLAKSLLERDKVKLLLVPHVIEKSSGHNDLLACRELWDKIGRDPRAHIIDENCDACMMKDAISRCDCFVGARTHSTIAALSTCVPTLSIAYSRKAYGLNLDIFGHTRYVLPADSISRKTLAEAFLLLEHEKDAIAATLARENARLRELADSAGMYLAKILGR
jgi:polysaccharide pyruvyl transferase WcaK-like protein